ncbi:MAG: Prolipoprotein diacylglyceryl transferase, partial [Myxococcaceae bacterium]|nr:Prolipoprotein diacylglyceryl transferase [Myxococcaceae bacterium]
APLPRSPRRARPERESLMHPSFGELFGEPLSAYFSLLLFGYAVAIYSVVRWAKRVGLDHQSVIDCGLASIIGGVLGGRLLHVVADGYFLDYVHLCTDPARVSWHITAAQCGEVEGLWDAGARLCHPVARDCLAWAKFYNGGLAYYGGLVGGTWGVLLIARRDKLPFLKLADMTSIGVAMGLFFGRIGCFLAGCCYGEVTSLSVGTRFPGWSPASEGQFREGLLAHPSLRSLPVHPTQLYEAVGCLLISVALSQWGPRQKRFDGQVALVALLAYALLRSLIEELRADDRGVYLGISTSQWVSLAIALVAAVAWRKWSHESVTLQSRGAA